MESSHFSDTTLVKCGCDIFFWMESFPCGKLPEPGERRKGKLTTKQLSQYRKRALRRKEVSSWVMRGERPEAKYFLFELHSQSSGSESEEMVRSCWLGPEGGNIVT